MDNSPRLKMCDFMGSAENGAMVGENMHLGSTLPSCKTVDQCKYDNGTALMLMLQAAFAFFNSK